ncbi:MAG: hypothetical protein ABI747_01560 [Candidatus Moraniibacteriota bacterium]
MMNQTTKFTFLLFGFLTLTFPGQVLATSPLLNSEVLKNINLEKVPLVKLPPAKAKNTEAFCADFTSTQAKIAKEFSEKRGKLDVFLKDKDQNLDDERNARDAKLEEARSKADQRRSEWYLRLEARAKTDDEKDAVTKFKQTVEKAVENRRESIDDAIADFRKSVDSALTSRQSSMETTRDAFQAAMDVALEQVKTDCDNNLTTVNIKKKFKDNLKVARAKLSSDKTNLDKVHDDIQTLATARRTIIKKAQVDFDAALASATAELKRALVETKE